MDDLKNLLVEQEKQSAVEEQFGTMYLKNHFPNRKSDLGDEFNAALEKIRKLRSKDGEDNI